MEETKIIFEKISDLLDPLVNSLVSELLLKISSTEISFRSAAPTSENKNHLLSIYTTRQQIEQQRREKFARGFDDFIPSLISTEVKNIRISTYTMETGTYLVFTDDKATKLIGVLYTNRILSEVRTKYKSGSPVEGKNFEGWQFEGLIYKNGLLIT